MTRAALLARIAADFADVRAEQAAGLCGGGLAEAIRTAVSVNPEATQRDVLDALPDLNKQTVRIQFNQSRALDAELNGE